MEYGERIRMLREQRGLSQSELARLLGVHKQTVSDVERGRQKRFAPEAEERLKELFGNNQKEDDRQILQAQEELLLYYFRRVPQMRRDQLFVELLRMLADGSDLNLGDGIKSD